MFFVGFSGGGGGGGGTGRERGEGEGLRDCGGACVWMQGRRRDRVRYVMHY